MTSYQFTIVVADDKPDIVDAIAKDLSMIAQKNRKSIKILKAISGSEVIKYAENENVDAFFIDYMFEYGMTGDEIIQNIEDPFESKFFILMSGWKEEVLENVINKNHHKLKSRCRFMRKPFDAITLQASFLDFISFFESRPYPLPMQYVYDVLNNSQEGIKRAFALKDFYETLLKFSASVLMADMLSHDEHHEFRAKINPEVNLTFGAWLTWLTNLLDFYGGENRDIFMPDLIRFYKETTLNPLKIISEFKEVRDSELGHGYLKDDSWYDSVAFEHQDKFTSLHKELYFLSRYTLMIPEKIDIQPDTDCYKYQVKSLMGSEMVLGKTELITPKKLLLNSVYLVSPTGNALLLSPFLIYKLCVPCQSNRLYFLDRIQKNSVSYNAFCNHRLEDIEARAQFISKFQYIFDK